MPTENPVLENVFGTIGAVLWSIQIIPQIVKSYRSKSTEGLSATLMFIWAVASIFLGTYAIVQNINVPIILQPQLFGVLAGVSWCQCLYYQEGLSFKKALAVFVAFCAVFGAFEGGMTVVLRNALNAGNDRPTFAFGLVSAILLAGALLPQYYEIWKYKEVKGLSITFMIVDIAGGVFCILSLAFKSEIDAVATANYAGVVILDGIVLALAVVLNPRANRRRRREAEAQLADAEKGEGGLPASDTQETAVDENAAIRAEKEVERTEGFHLHSTAPDEDAARREGLAGAQSARPHHPHHTAFNDEERTLNEEIAARAKGTVDT